MAKKANEEIIKPDLSPAKAIELFRRQISKIDDLTTKSSEDPEAQGFRNFNVNLIIRTFGKPSENLSSYYSAEHPGAMYVGMSDREWDEVYQKGLQHIKKLFEGFIDQLEVFSTDSSPQDVKKGIRKITKDIFIVHGHDEAIRESVARFVEKLDLIPVILHEKPNAGQTVIEKLESQSDVGFAIVLLTPDDVGAPKEDEKSLKARARQNVILELGYFFGKLGRSMVCAIYKEDVEIPSDILGVLYIPMDKGGAWKLRLVKEIKQAGIEIDLNKVI